MKRCKGWRIRLRSFTYITAHFTARPLLHLRHRHFTYVIAHSPILPPLHQRHRSSYNPSVASPTSQALHVLHLAILPCIGGWTNSMWWTSLLHQVAKFRSSYSFGYLLRILLRAVNLFSSRNIVSSDPSFNIHNALYFVKYPSRAARNSPEGRRRPAGRGLKTSDLEVIVSDISLLNIWLGILIKETTFLCQRQWRLRH